MEIYIYIYTCNKDCLFRRNPITKHRLEETLNMTFIFNF